MRSTGSGEGKVEVGVLLRRQAAAPATAGRSRVR